MARAHRRGSVLTSLQSPGASAGAGCGAPFGGMDSAAAAPTEEEAVAAAQRKRRVALLWQKLRRHARMVGAAAMQQKARTVHRVALEQDYGERLLAAAERFDRRHHTRQSAAEALCAKLPVEVREKPQSAAHSMHIHASLLFASFLFASLTSLTFAHTFLVGRVGRR